MSQKKGKFLTAISLIIIMIATMLTPVLADEGSMQELMDRYWEKGVSIQYQSGGDGIGDLLDLTKEEVQYTVCSDFTYDFYKSNYNITIGHSTKALMNEPNTYYTFDKATWEEMVNQDTWFELFHKNVKVGDLINIRRDGGTGHVMMVHSVTDDDVLLIHSTGSNTKEEKITSEYDGTTIEGSIRKNWLSTLFKKSYMKGDVYMGYLIRPLGVEENFEMVLPEKEQQEEQGEDVTEPREVIEEEQPKDEEIIIPQVVDDGLSHLAIMTDPHVQYAAIDGTEEHTKLDEQGKKVHNNTLDGTQATVFGNALLDAQRRNAHAILVSGDLTYNSKPEQFELYLDTVNKYSNVPVIEAMGNHDLAGSNENSRNNLRDQWEQYIGEKIYYDTWVGDVHVIVLGSDTNENSTSMGSYSQTQIDWLKELLDKDLENNTTSVILTHWPVNGTFPAHTQENAPYYNGDIDEQLYDLVDTHKNTIVFSGHTHASYKTNGQLRIFRTENGGMFVHAGIIYAKSPVYVMMDEIPSDDSIKYSLSYVSIDSNPLGTFEFEHSLKKEESIKEKSEMQKLYDKYYEKGILLQYVNKGETYFPTVDLSYPEAQNTQCAHFTNSFYTNEFGIKLANSVTKINGLEQTNVIKTILYEDWKKLVEDGKWREELLSDLQEGDIITVRHPDLSQSIGHAMMVYEVLEDDAILIHSTGSNSKTDSIESEVEKGFIEGSVRKNYLSTLFEKNYVNAERDVRIARPLAVKVIEPTKDTKSNPPEEFTVDSYEYKATFKNGIDDSVISEEVVSGTNEILTIEGVNPLEMEGYTFKEWKANQVVFLQVSGGSNNGETAQSYLHTEVIEVEQPIASILSNRTESDGRYNELQVQVSNDTVFTALYEKVEPIDNTPNDENTPQEDTNQENTSQEADNQEENNQENNNQSETNVENNEVLNETNDEGTSNSENTTDNSENTTEKIETDVENKPHENQENSTDENNENNEGKSPESNISKEDKQKEQKTEINKNSDKNSDDNQSKIEKNQEKSSKNDSPKTGDNNKLNIYLLLCIFSIDIILIIKKKQLN